MEEDRPASPSGRSSHQQLHQNLRKHDAALRKTSTESQRRRVTTHFRAGLFCTDLLPLQGRNRVPQAVEAVFDVVSALALQRVVVRALVCLQRQQRQAFSQCTRARARPPHLVRHSRSWTSSARMSGSVSAVRSQKRLHHAIQRRSARAQSAEARVHEGWLNGKRAHCPEVLRHWANQRQNKTRLKIDVALTDAFVCSHAHHCHGAGSPMLTRPGPDCLRSNKIRSLRVSRCTHHRVKRRRFFLQRREQKH